jgi:hypothetical protein
MDEKKRWEIIESFGKVLEKISPFTVGLESDLLFPKNLIRLAIVQQFFNETDPEIKERLKTGLILTDSFLPMDEFKIFKDIETTIYTVENVKPNSESSLDIDLINNVIDDIKQKPLDKYLEILKIIEEKRKRRIEQLEQLEKGGTEEQLKKLFEEIVMD